MYHPANEKTLKINFKSHQNCRFFVILIIGIYLYFTVTETGKGEEWCAKMMYKFDTDSDKFFETHADILKDGRIILAPGAEDKNVMGQFTVQLNGEYRCRYSHGGMSKPHTYQFTSKVRKWIKID